uniref:SHSP domain-containing protein n=1 Tax=Panagrolaimus sp. ES5 TaxID=591445 RepID=A0AC34FHJ7_9BILA
MYSYFDPFEHGRDRRRPPHHHSYGPDEHHRHGHWPPPPFGPDSRRHHGWGPHEHGGGDCPPFGPFGPHGGRGRGGFGPWGPSGHGWGPEDDYSSSEDDEQKKPEDGSSSDSSSDSNSDSDVDCHGKGRRGRGHHRRGRPPHRRGCPHRRGGHGHGEHGHGHCWPPHGHGHHRRHGGGGHCWPPHHHHHQGGRDSGGPGAEASKDLPVEDASGFGSDFQVIQDDVVSQMNNLQLQDDRHEDQSTKKCFKIALNADGFKIKDIRIRRHQNQLRVEGKQDAKTYLGTFQRSFAYTITIPSGVNPKKIKTKLGPDGVLRIKAKKSRNETDNEEIEEIPIKE